jgi:hypothetical protein
MPVQLRNILLLFGEFWSEEVKVFCLFPSEGARTAKPECKIGKCGTLVQSLGPHDSSTKTHDSILHTNWNLCGSWDSSVVQRWVTGWIVGDSSPGGGWEIFPSTTASRPALGTTQPPIQWVPAAFFLGLKRPVCEADHSPPSSAEVKNAWSYTSTFPIRLHCVELS